MVVGEQDGSGGDPFGVRGDRNHWAYQRALGVAVERVARWQPPPATGLVDRGGADHDRFTADRPGVDVQPFGDRGEAVRGPAVEVLHGGVIDRIAGDDDLIGVTRDDGSDLDVGWRHDLTADDQPPDSVAIGAHHDPVGVDQRAGSRYELDPGVVVVAPDRAGTSRGDIDRQDLEPALVAGLHRDGQPVLVPVHVRQVRKPDPVPGDLQPGVAVECHEVQRDIGIRCARSGIPDGVRSRARVGRIRDVPDLHRFDVDAAHGQGGAVGRPPEPAMSAHLLGGDEVGTAPGHGVGVARLGHQAASVALQVRHPQLAAPNEGDLTVVRRGARCRPRIEDRPVDRNMSRPGGVEVGGEQLAGERERGERRIFRQCVRCDTAGAFAHSFTPRPFLGRQVGIVAGHGRQQRNRIGDQRFVAGRGVGPPQAIDRVGAGPAAGEHDLLPIGRDREIAWLAERQSLSSGVLARERVVHIEHARA